MKQLSPLTWKYQLSIQIRIIILITNLHLISLNGHLSSHLKNNSQTSQFTKHVSSVTLEEFKNCGMTPFLPSANLYQQNRSDQHTNISNQNIKIYLTLSSYQTHILNLPQKNKTMKHSQDQSELILLKITPFPHQKHQNQMPNSIYTLMMTVGLTFLLLLYFPWLPN